MFSLDLVIDHSFSLLYCSPLGEMSLFTISAFGGNLESFQCKANANNAAVNILVHGLTMEMFRHLLVI